MTRETRTPYSAVVAAYGVLVIVANLRNGFLPSSYTGDWVFFGGGSDIPGDLGRNVFGGSVALGALILVLAVTMWLLAGRRAALPVGALAVAFSVVLLVLYDADGNLLAARPAPAAVLAAAALTLIASRLAVPDRGQPVDAAR